MTGERRRPGHDERGEDGVGEQGPGEGGCPEGGVAVLKRRWFGPAGAVPGERGPMAHPWWLPQA